VDAIAAGLVYAAGEREAALRRLQARARRLVLLPPNWQAVERIAALLQQRLPQWWIQQSLDAEVPLSGDEARQAFDAAGTNGQR
jgi:hypothetical protein